jgi:hypothetical protein
MMPLMTTLRDVNPTGWTPQKRERAAQTGQMRQKCQNWAGRRPAPFLASAGPAR